MSDRETIAGILVKAQSRIRRNLLVDRLAPGVAAFALAGVLVKLVGLIILLSPGFLRLFWVIWLAGLAGFAVRNLRTGGDLQTAAGDLDDKARLNDEILSAWWFLNHPSASPWTELQVRRAAESIRKLDLGRLYSQPLPRSSYVAAAGFVLLIALNFAPLPFTPNLLFSTPVPDLEALDRQSRLNEIEALLAEAEALEQDANQAISEFQDLVEQMRDAGLTLEDTADQAGRVDSLLDEGNLNMNSLLEGLESMAEDLLLSEETAPAGRALSEGDLETAAQELEQLAEALGGGTPASEELQEALREATENPRAGLEELADALAEAAEAMANQDSQSAGESLSGAADSLNELADLIESQQLQNLAAQQMEALREALQQQQNQQAQQGEPGQQNGESSSGEGEQGQQQEPGNQAGDAAAGTPQEGEGGTPQEGSQPGSAEGASEFVPGQSPEGATSNQDAPPITGDLQNIEPTGTGDTPTGIGFSPDQKTGAPTSLEVQLQLQTTLAPSAEVPEEEQERREEATRQEQSNLDYRNVPTQLTPAQQELLNQEPIPREYQNVIKEYFQAIRPQP